MTVIYWLLETVNAMDKWITSLVLVCGLALSVWAYLRCQKRGYLLVGSYFLLYLFMLLVMPPIKRAIQSHREPTLSQQEQKKLNEAVQETIVRVNAEMGYPDGRAATVYVKIHLPLDQICLVTGLWLIAKREPQKNPEPTAATTTG